MPPVKAGLIPYSGLCKRWRRGEGKYFIELTIYKLYRNLHARQVMLVREINCLLRMFEIKSLERIRRPISQCAEIKLRARVLQ